MSTKTKLIISLILIAVILGVAGVSIYLVLTVPPSDFYYNNVTVTYDTSDISASVSVKKQIFEMNESTNSLDDAYLGVDNANFSFESDPVADSAKKSKYISLGTLDIKEGEVERISLYFDIIITNTSKKNIVAKLNYSDYENDDKNMSVVVSATQYSTPTSVNGNSVYIENMTVHNGWSFTTDSAEVNAEYTMLTIKVDLRAKNVNELSRFTGNFVLTLEKSA